MGCFSSDRTVVAVWAYFDDDDASHISAVITRGTELRCSTARGTYVSWWTWICVSPLGSAWAVVMFWANLAILNRLSYIWWLHVYVYKLCTVVVCCQAVVIRTIDTRNRISIVALRTVMTKRAFKFVPLLPNITDSFFFTSVATFAWQTVSYTSFF